MNAAQSSFLSQAEALSSYVDQMARGASIKEEALVSLGGTLRAARRVARALDGEAAAEAEGQGQEEGGEEAILGGGTGDAVFKTAVLALATKLIGRIRKLTPSRHEATRKARVLIKAITLYLLWAKTEPGALQGRCERIKASAKVALDLFSEEGSSGGSSSSSTNGSTTAAGHDLLVAEMLAAANYCVDAFAALEKEGGEKGLGKQLPAAEVEAVAIGASKALEVLLALMWRGAAAEGHQAAAAAAPHAGGGEMARRVETLLRAALLRPQLLGKRAVTVSGDVARRLTKAGQLKAARDCLVAALQALETMAAGGKEGCGRQQWMATAQAALQWLLSECHSQLGETEKALSGLYALEALQKQAGEGDGAAAAAEGNGGAVIPSHKVELAKIAYLLRGGTTEGLRAARACVLGLAAASAGSSAVDGPALLQAALKGARALVGFSRYTPDAFAIYDEVEKAAGHSSSTSGAIGAVAGERALVLATALQSTAAAAPALQQALLAQLVKVLAPLTASPGAAAALSARDRERLRNAVRQAIWANPLKYAGKETGVQQQEGEEGAEEGTGTGQWWGQVAALCDALLALLAPGDAAAREQALCTQAHALLELGRLDEAFAAAQRACGLTSDGARAEQPPSLLAAGGGGSSSKARANLCWVACLVALRRSSTSTSTASPSPVLTVLQALLACPSPTPAARLSGLLELATLVVETVAPAAPPLAARLLKSVLEEVLRVWLEGGGSTTTAATRPGSKRGRPGSAASTTGGTTAFPWAIPLPAPVNGSGIDSSSGDGDAMDGVEGGETTAVVGFFATCRALLEATLRCALPAASLEGVDKGTGPTATAYPAAAFADAGAARECWRAVALFALPALDKLQQQRQQQQAGDGAAALDAMPKSLREDLRWLSALCTNIATGLGGSGSSSTATTGTATAPPRHELLVAAYRFFDAALSLALPGGGGAVAEADERRRVVLLMLAVSASLAARTGGVGNEGSGGGLNARERSYWLAQLGEIRSRTAALAKTPALMPLARNLQKTGLALELMVRASSSSSGGSEGGEEVAAATATSLSQLLAREEAELLSLPVEVLHALARACQDPAASPAAGGNAAARKLYRLALKLASSQAAAQQPGQAAQAQAFWLFLDLFQAAPTLSAALGVAKEFKQRADGFRPGTANMAETKGQQGQEQEQEKPLVALRTVAARMAIALYNEGVARLELVQADAEMYVAGALTLLPYADEDFQANFCDQMESVLTVAKELRSAEGTLAASLLAGEGTEGGEGNGAATAAAATVMEE